MKMSSTDVEEKISNKQDFAVEGEEGHDAGKGEEEVVAGGKVEDDLDGGGQVDEVEDEGEEESRVFIQNITATVLSAHRFGIYISFVHEENSEIGVLFPGKSFVNGTLLLGDAVRTDQELSLLFPVGLKVYADMVSQVPRLVPESGSSPSFRDDKGEEKKCCWVINCLWVGDLDCKPDKNSLNDGTLFRAEDSSFKECMDCINARVMEENSSTDQPLFQACSLKWFLVAISMPKPNMLLEHPDSALKKGEMGTIVAIHRPHGGIIACDDTEVFFHRSRVYLNGVHLSVTTDLLLVLQVGMKVIVEYSPNSSPGGQIFEDCPAPYIALLAYTGPRPTVPEIRHKPFPLAVDSSNKYLVAKIVKFDPPGPTGVESGIAEVLRPSDLNTLAFTKNSFKRYIEVDTTVKFVHFHRDKMFHLGALQYRTDLQYFFSSSAFGMNIFYCYAEPLAGSDGEKVLFNGEPVTHEITLGWKGSVSFLHATGQGGLTLTPNTKEDTLLYPRIFSFQSTRFLGREGMNIKLYEDIVEGSIPPRAVYLNGYSSSASEGTVCARVHDILPPQGSSGVSTGIVYIESGEYMDMKAVFDRSVCSVFGWSLEKTDLQYILELNEPCFVHLDFIPDSEEADIKLRVTCLWVGWPKEHASYQHPRDIPIGDRHKLLLFLDAHDLSIKEFLQVLKGDKPPRIFIPFRKDEMKGTVVQLDRGCKLRGVGPKEQKGGRDAGAVCGVIKVDKGALIGALVTFHRRNTWVLGYNMGKVDLTNLFIEGQKVSLEVVPISADDRKKYPGLPYQNKYRATLVWTSKFRPRNDVVKTVPESVHVNNWLKKRGLSWDKFQILVKGKLPIVPPLIATRHRTNMLRGGELEELLENNEKTESGQNTADDRFTPRLESLPVFRHGSDAVRICDEALSVVGPSDPRIFRIIQNDGNAQMAFHIHKALGYALEEYKKVTGRVAPANYSGFGDVFRSGPPILGLGVGGPGPVLGPVGPIGPGGHGPGPWGGIGLLPPPGPPFNFNIGPGSYQQANQMASRLQQMAMEEGGRRREIEEGGRRWDQQEGGKRRDQSRGEEWEEGDERRKGWEAEGRRNGWEADGDGFAGGGTKRQMNNQGGNRGKKNRGGWNR